MEVSEIMKFLRTIRNDLPRENDKGKSAARKLFSSLTDKKDWTNEELQSFYEFLLEKYVDDVSLLEQLKAASGLSPGYRSPKWNAAKRRGRYIEDLQKALPQDEADKVRGPSSLLKDENIQLSSIAKSLKEAYDAGTMPELLKEWKAYKSKNSQSPTDEMQKNDDGYQDPRTDQKIRKPIAHSEARQKVQKNKDNRRTDKNNNFITNKVGALLQIQKTDNRTYQFFFPKVPPQTDSPKRRQNKKIGTVLLLVFLGALLGGYIYWYFTNKPPVEEIFVSSEDIVLEPGEVYQLAIAVLPPKAQNTPLSYVSSDTSVITVSHEGLVLARGNEQSAPNRKADITIQAESGATANKPITVQNNGEPYEPLITDIDNFTPNFMVEQKVRLVDTDEWGKAIEAQIGDIVEFQIQYKNISDDDQDNVMVKDILPSSLHYVPGTTKVYNSVNRDGIEIEQDYIATDKAIKIGNYKPGANAYVRFSAEVVGDNLRSGSNTLVNWSQCCVQNVTLQDFAAVTVYKSD